MILRYSLSKAWYCFVIPSAVGCGEECSPPIDWIVIASVPPVSAWTAAARIVA